MERTRARESSRDRGDRDSDRSESRRGGREEGGRSSGRRSAYSYEKRDASAVEKRSTQGANEFDKFLKDSVKMFKPADKENVIRLLPPTWEKPKHYGLDIHVHYGIGPDRQTYLCLHKMKGEACPICEERQRALDDGDEKYAKELEPKRRVLVYLINRDAEKEGLLAWAMPWTVDRDICAISVDKRSGEVLPIDHPEEGFDVMFEKKGAKDRTEYVGLRIDRRDSALGNDAWLDAAMDMPLPDTLVYYDYDHIAKTFGGGGAHRDARGSDRDDDRPSRGRDRETSRDDDRPSRGRREEPKDELTWESVHALEGDALDDLIDTEKLDLNPAKFDSDEELADAICEELKIDKPAPASTRRRVVDDDKPAKDEGRDRLASMRERRSRD